MLPTMQIPPKTECYRLMAEMRMLDNIVAHSIQVSRVSLLLADRMQTAGITLNRELLQAAALLHDITKTRSFETGEMHTETGGELLHLRGYPEVGHIVRQHVRLDSYSAAGPPTEAEIVNYADKRVLHDHVVSLNRRMEYIVQRYGTNPQVARRLDWLCERSLAMEARIFAHLPFPCGSLPDLLPEAGLEDELAGYRAICEGA